MENVANVLELYTMYWNCIQCIGTVYNVLELYIMYILNGCMPYIIVLQLL